MNNIDLPALQDVAAKCELCELHKNRIEPVFARGVENTDVVVCGMCPGPDENKAGSPFVGKSGQLLDKILDQSVGTSVYITNLVKCFVQPGTDLQEEWMSRCLPYFVVQMQLIRPKVIITLGKNVADFFIPNYEKTMKFMRGRVHYGHMGANLITTYHPSYLARGGGINHRHYGSVVKDFNKAREFI